MKKLALIIFIMVALFSSMSFGAEDYSQILQKQQQAVDVEQFKETIDKIIGPESKEIIPQFSVSQLIKDISLGNVSFNIKDILDKVLKYLFKEIYINLNIIIKIIVLVLLCALLQNLQSAFGKEGVGEIAFYSCYILIATILVKNFLTVLAMGKDVIDSMVMFMQALIPIVFTLLLTTGNVTSAAVLQPGILFSIEIMGILLSKLILPMILFYTVLAIVNNISNKVEISKLAEFIKNVGIWMIGILLTVFIAIITLQSTITSVTDGIGTRTAKFAVSTFIPVVGKILSDAVDTVVGYSVLLKNSISVIGMIVIILICLVPIIKLFALIIIYKLTAAIIQPVSDERIVKCISEMGNSLTFVTAAVISVAVMFLISVSIVINAGNTVVMMR